MKAGMRLIVATTVLAVLLGSASTVQAGEGDPPRIQWQEWVIQGEVLGAGTKFILLAASRGEIPIMTGEMTIFRVSGVEDGSIADIAVGDRIVVVGRRVGPIAAARLVAVLEPDTELTGIGGQVGSVDGTRISVNSRPGDVIVLDTDEDTLVFEPGAGEVTTDEVQVGDVIAAAGVWSADGILQTFVILLPTQLQREIRVTGEIEAVEASILTLSTGEGRQVILETDEETAFHALEEEKTLQDLRVGQKVTATARVRESSLYASRVLLWPDNPTRLDGRVAGVEAETLWLDTRRGRVEVLVGDSTIIHVPGVEDPSIQDLEVGYSLTCLGAEEGSLTVHALVIAVHRQP